ncbi:response regulator transcription factor [Sporosarcina limicola]|uniref:Two-component system competent response regulator ComA n=1 Tax=Sporosarcina limicola TaxID=34101 RepID=A0A927MM64_9BACL|nr:response regulator transcription factor [Sporosarcina limicola]MBE1555447.1 two-component system competent response regulator ComA [Sporosarcina limicola]
MIRILIVDDHIAVALGTKLILEKEKDFQVIALNSGKATLALLKEKKFDIFMFDLKMPEMNGHDLAKKVIELNPEAKIIIYTGYEIEPYFNSLFDSGVLGFISKTDSEEQIIKIIRSLLTNDVIIPINLLKQLREVDNRFQLEKRSANPLNAKEMNILEQVALGKTNIEIADLLFQSTRTVEYQLTNIFKKLNVESRKKALERAKELNIISIIE